MRQPFLLPTLGLVTALLHICGCQDAVDPVSGKIVPPLPTPKPPPPPSGCLITPSENQLFNSYNFPSVYNSSTDCNYTLATEDGKRIQLTIFYFETEQHPNCYYDKMTVYDTDLTTLRILCGKNSQNYVVTSTGSNMTLNFKTDSQLELTGWLAIWNAVDASAADEPVKQGEYVITLPGTLVEENSEEVCVELFDPDRKEALITADLYVRSSTGEAAKTEFRDLKPLLSETAKIEKCGPKTCFNLTLAAGASKTSNDRVINIKITDGAAYNVNVYRKIFLMGKERYSLIQTDKGKYKPKDTVKFRILVVESDLLAAGITSLDEVWVEDVQNRRIQQWREVPLKSGIMQQEFELGEEPALGFWTIHFTIKDKKDTAYFEVAEYVLPKFDVQLKGPDAILRNAATVTWRVCAKYTFGGKVKGSVEANFRSEYRVPTWRPPPPIVKEINMTATVDKDDCALLVLSKEQIKNLTVKVDYFSLNIKFIEDGTAVEEKATWSGALVDKAFNINFLDSSDQFIVGGFPYTGEVRITNYDGSGRPGEPLEICVRLFRDIEVVRSIFQNNPGLWSMNEDDFIGSIPAIQNLTYQSECHDAVTDSAGRYSFYVPMTNVPKDVVKLSVKVTAVKEKSDKLTGMVQPSEKLEVRLEHTESSLALSLVSKDRDELACGSAYSARVFLAGPPESTVQLHYYVMTQGAVLDSASLSVPLTGQDQTAELVGEKNLLSVGQASADDTNVRSRLVRLLQLPLTIDYRAAPKLKLLVLVTDTGNANETLTDSHIYSVEPCTRHRVQASWSADKAYPGSPVSLAVKADAGSYCGISATDKSVELMGNPNKITKVRLTDLTESIKSQKAQITESYWDYQSKCPQAYKVLNEFQYPGITIITNLGALAYCQTLTNATQDNPEFPVQFEEWSGVAESGSFMTRPAPAFAAFAAQQETFNPTTTTTATFLANRVDQQEVAKPVVTLRQFFPETWLFQLNEISSDGQLDRSLETPHTITGWDAEAVCISPLSGLGVATPANLTVSQDFFADLNLPYSVKRGETFPLNISIFNYLPSQQLPLVVTVVEADLDLGQNSWSVCLEAGDRQVLTTRATARSLGELNITVEAKIANIEGCATIEQGLGFKDALVKPLRVKPEGIPVEKVQSEFKCLPANSTGDTKVELERLELPSNVVEGSERAWLSITGDIMAPALENVGSLVNMPTGCGEQNMVGLVPNIYLLQYLKSNAKEEPVLEKKAKEYMEIGYNRQQKYRHPDGAYSIWGPGDKDGSTWLTSFVVKSFAEASEFIAVDKATVEESVRWLTAAQNDSTGCFLKRGYVYSSDLQGGNTDDSLTSFVLTALLEATSRLKIEVDNKIIESALDCAVKGLNSSDIYSTSVTAYAAQLLKLKLDQGGLGGEYPQLNAQIDSMMEKLSAAANTSIPGARFWDQTTKVDNGWWSYSRSKAVEMTAYNVLSLTISNNLEDAVDAVKWLARQRNSQGGFVSTQDTVVALQALSVYAQSVSQDPTDLSVQVGEQQQADQPTSLGVFKLDEDNQLLLQTQKVDSLPSQLQLAMRGSGCTLVQTVLRYNIHDAPNNRNFKLTVTPEEDHLRICAAYTGDKDMTDMAVIEVELVTGWEAYNPDYLLNEVDSGVRRVEEDKKENKVVLYFDDIPKKERCLDLEVKEVMQIENAKAARAVVYDYYNTEDRTEITYSMK